MIRVQFIEVVFALGAVVVPSMVENIPSQCRLIRYGGIDIPVESFPCRFLYLGGNVTVDSKDWALPWKGIRARLLFLSIAFHLRSLEQSGILSRRVKA